MKEHPDWIRKAAEEIARFTPHKHIMEGALYDEYCDVCLQMADIIARCWAESVDCLVSSFATEAARSIGLEAIEAERARWRELRRVASAVLEHVEHKYNQQGPPDPKVVDWLYKALWDVAEL